MSDNPTGQTLLRVADLPPRKPYRFDLRPAPDVLESIADELGLSDLRKLRFSGTLRPDGRKDWRLDATLGATVVQPCVVSLQPVTTRIDGPVERLFTHDWANEVAAEEMEMPEDDTTEPLGSEIDLEMILTEALALALPDYPRAGDAHLDQVDFAAPGVTPMSDEDVKPFAGLADLKNKLAKPE